MRRRRIEGGRRCLALLLVALLFLSGCGSAGGGEAADGTTQAVEEQAGTSEGDVAEKPDGSEAGTAASDAGEPLAHCSPASAGELLLFTAKQTVFYKNQKVDLGILTFAV